MQHASRSNVGKQPPASATPRGRPTAERITLIDAAIRESALAVFVEVGFEATSMEAIAAGAGVSKGTLYARYENKEILFRATLEEELERLSQRAGKKDHLLPDDLGGRLRHHARSLIAVFSWPEYKRIFRLLDGATPTLPDLARHWEDIGTNRYLRFLADDMAKAAGGKGQDWDFYARVFLFGISGLHRANAASETAAAGDVTSFADRLIEVIQLAASADARRSGGQK